MNPLPSLEELLRLGDQIRDAIQHREDTEALMAGSVLLQHAIRCLAIAEASRLITQSNEAANEEC